MVKKDYAPYFENSKHELKTQIGERKRHGCYLFHNNIFMWYLLYTYFYIQSSNIYMILILQTLRMRQVR